MKLVFDQSACTECGACSSTCPKDPKGTKILLCRHCPPERAECKEACKAGAIKESGGFLFVSEEECTGCGECAEKCPHGAIEIEGGIAKKCDGCLGEPKCIDYCPEEALRLMGEGDSALGWRISAEGGYSAGLPVLTSEEQELVLEVFARFRESSKKGEFADEKSAAGEIGRILRNLCEEMGIMMETDQFDYLSRVSLMQLWGFGPLDPLLSDDSLEEIAVIGLKKPVYVYRRGEGWLSTDCEFTSQEVFVNLVNKMARPLGRRLTYQAPRLNAVLPNGSRLHASIPPISQLELTIRKFRSNPISVPDLARFKTFSPESLAFLWLAMETDLSLVIAGNTASGKTSTLNALFSFVPLDERVLVTEETPEINIPHRHRVNLLANPELGIGMGDLTADSLRMRPDRVIVGEVRTGQETKALIEAITSGQARGSYATFHAHSGNEVVARMRSLGIPDTDIASIDLIVIQKRIAGAGNAREIRRAVEISEVRLEGNSVKVIPIYLYDYEEKMLARTKNDSKAKRGIMLALGIGEREFEKELASRAKVIAGLSNKERGFFETVASIQNYRKRRGGLDR